MFECKGCGECMLSEADLRRYKNGNGLRKDSCVTIPKMINGKEYFRVRCDSCFEKQFGRKPKKMNAVNDDMIYLLDAKESDLKEQYQMKAVTEKNLIKRYGKEEGLKKWEQYKSKQAMTNTFEYKQKKYGWTKEQFDEYNSTRAVTIENCIKKHGKEKGTKVFNDYVEKQKYAGCKEEYFIEKYGKEEGTKKYLELNKKKRLTRENFIRKYGEKEGNFRYNEYHSNKANGFSIMSQELFEMVDVKIKNNKHTYFHSKNNEYAFECKHNTYFTDFYDSKSKKVIEFAGNYWHCNPKMYKEDFYVVQQQKYAKEIWEYDANRIKDLKEQHGIEVLTIWERDYLSNKEEVVEQCVRFINGI